MARLPKAERLLSLMQILRRHRYPVSGADLALELKISLRTLYRDIQSLQSQGALIEGEAGLGYILRPSFNLPPLMFSITEIEALVLGARWVAEKADHQLGQAAIDVLAKVASVLSPELRQQLENSSLIIGPTQQNNINNAHLIAIRQSIQNEKKIAISYIDLKDSSSERVIWPFALGFFDHVNVVVAWCELRQQIRHFRLDRINELQRLNQSYPQSRRSLLKQWREQENIPERYHY